MVVLNRYKNINSASSYRDPLEDLIVSSEFLLSPEYLSDLLVSKHGVTAADARKRAVRIAAHVRLALAFLRQAFAGPPDAAFLPTYYALLNLAKVYILSSTKHQQLSQNRWHGASYDVFKKASHSLRTEVITLHQHGAISLFYEAITGLTIPKKLTIRIGDLYPYIQDVGSEWILAAGAQHVVRGATFWVITEQPSKEKRFRALVGHRAGLRQLTVRNVPALIDVRHSATNAQEFVSKKSYPQTTADDEILGAHVRTQLLYYNLSPKQSLVPTCPTGLLMFEELPILLVFFHLSSVVRYNPEFLARLRESRYWPVISSLRYHGVTEFMILFWSYMQQEQIVFTTPSAGA